MLYPIILSGGFGGRLWPVSRVNMPKQFLSLVTEKSLLQETVIRLKGIPNMALPTLVCNERHRFIAAEQLRAIGTSARKIFLEPESRDTAPAIAVAAQDALNECPDALLLVLPSDHSILNIPSLHNAIQEALPLANQGYIMTFGILPNAPKTSYGYIQQGPSVKDNTRYHHVARFVEKPDKATAQYYLKSKEYLWNSGIFMFRADSLLAELNVHAPEIALLSNIALNGAREDTDFCWLEQSAFHACPTLSIDYALMEKTKQAVVVPVDMGWSDVGSWGALWEVVSKDAQGNVTKGHVHLKDVTNCYIKSDKEIVAAIGLKDLIIIDTEDALLITHRNNEQEVKTVFKKLM